MEMSAAPESATLDGQELVNFQQSVQANRYQQQTSPHRTEDYAELDFNSCHPVPPPSLEAVTYAQPVAVGLKN